LMMVLPINLIPNPATVPHRVAWTSVSRAGDPWPLPHTRGPYHDCSTALSAEDRRKNCAHTPKRPPPGSGQPRCWSGENPKYRRPLLAAPEPPLHDNRLVLSRPLPCRAGGRPQAVHSFNTKTSRKSIGLSVATHKTTRISQRQTPRTSQVIHFIMIGASFRVKRKLPGELSRSCSDHPKTHQPLQGGAQALEIRRGRYLAGIIDLRRVGQGRVGRWWARTRRNQPDLQPTAWMHADSSDRWATKEAACLIHPTCLRIRQLVAEALRGSPRLGFRRLGETPLREIRFRCSPY
jgi:hypothetical protein